MTTFNNYADVQAGLTNFVNQSGVNVDGAPHGAFWQSMTYTEFTTGNMPLPSGDGTWPILEIGNSAGSNLVQILEGTGAAAQKFGRMPRPRPPYNPEQQDLITALAAWIDAGCPNPASNEAASDEEVGPEDEGIQEAGQEDDSE